MGQREFKDIDGQWLMGFASNDIGYVRTLITFETKDSLFKGYTRRNAARDILGPTSSFLAKMFAGLKKGSFLRIEKGKLRKKGDELVLKGIFHSPLGSYYFNGTLKGDTLRAELLDYKKELKGKMIGVKNKATVPLSDYKSIAAQAIQVSKERVYSTAVTKTEKWTGFEKKLSSAAGKAKDDLEMIFAFFNYSRKLPVSHFALTKVNNHPELNMSEAETPNAILKEKSADLAYLNIKSFNGSAAEIDDVFRKILAKNYKTLIVDLRENPGGSIEAGMRFASYVADSSYYGGIFLTRKYFDKNTAIPTVDKYPAFQHFTEANYNLIMEGLHNYEGMCIKVIPNHTTYKGKMYVLTSHATASTCEPIVYGLKLQKRAVIVGERTAGQMLSAEPFPLSDEFQVYVPIGDYYAADGARLDQKGAEPDHKVPSSKAYDFVIKLISQK
jgi:hypothetical protein